MASLFKDFKTKPFMKRKPPSDNSFDTDQELKQLAKIPINKKFINDKDDVEATFKKTAKQAGVEYPSALVKKLMDDSTGPILKLKKHFNRPRPHVLAKKRNMKLDHVELKSMKTPSYPSGHSAQGALIGEALADMYPKAADKFRKAGKDISRSRNVARAHYASDSKFGEELGKKMYEHYKVSNRQSPLAKKPAGAPDWHDSDAPDAKGKFKNLSASGLASWLIKSRKGNLSKIISSLNQQIVFNRKKNPSYASKMRKTQDIVRSRLGKKKDGK
jgi:hypothetical protein